MTSRVLLLHIVVLLSLIGAAFGAPATAKDPKPADCTEAVVAQAIGFLPSDLKAQLTACRKEIVAAAKPEAGKPDDRFGFASKDDEGARKAFAEAFDGVRKGVEKGKSVADLKIELGRVALYVISASQPYRSDKAAFDSAARSEFEQKLDASCATLKAKTDGFQRATDAAKLALEISAKAKKLLADESKPDQLPSAVFSLASNSLTDVWQSLLTKPGTDGTGEYIGNKSSKKFHLSTCRHMPAEKNQIRFATRQEAVDAGYEPCKVCKP